MLEFMKWFEEVLSLRYVLVIVLCFAIPNIKCFAEHTVTADEYTMPYHISDMTLSSDSSYLCLTFMQSGRTARYGVFELESRQLTWMSETMDIERGKVEPTKYGMLVMRDWGLLWNISLIDAQRGVAVWSEPGVGGFRYDERCDMALAVKKNVKEPGLILKAFNISNGDTLWRYRIEQEFVQGMNGGMYPISDSVALVVADQLCLVSRSEGNINYCAYDEPVQGGDLPVLIRGSRIFVSDKHHVTCYNKWLHAQWTASHPTTGRCRLQKVGKYLYLINDGYIRKMLPADDRGVAPIVKQQVCKPFVACYDAESGGRQSLAYINWKQSDGALERIYVNAVFYTKDENTDDFRKIVTPTNGCFVKTDDGSIFVLNEKMKVKEGYKSGNVYHRQFLFNGYVGLLSDNDAYVASVEGKVQRHLPLGIKDMCRINKEVFYCIGDKLYSEPLQ